jgi:hypothetical protein
MGYTETKLVQLTAAQAAEAALLIDCARDLGLAVDKRRLNRMSDPRVRQWALTRLVQDSLLRGLHLRALRIVSEALGNPYAGDLTATAIDLAIAAAVVIRQKLAADKMRGFEMSFAYERATGMIENSCIKEEHEDALENGWYDLASSDEDLTDEVAYLDSRRLLMRHPGNPQLVTICDEGEPLPESEAT